MQIQKILSSLQSFFGLQMPAVFELKKSLIGWLNLIGKQAMLAAFMWSISSKKSQICHYYTYPLNIFVQKKVIEFGFGN